MTPEEQLQQWVYGNPIHNTDQDECCPDFSCCKKDLLAPVESRQRFAKAHRDGNETIKAEMLGMFLGAAMQAAGRKDVYVAGQESPGLEH